MGPQDPIIFWNQEGIRIALLSGTKYTNTSLNVGISIIVPAVSGHRTHLGTVNPDWQVC